MSDRLTDDEIKTLRSVTKSMTKGTWTTDKPSKDGEGWQMGVRICSMGYGTSVYSDPPGGQMPWADARGIAAMRNAIDRLLDEIEERRRAERSVATVFDEAAEQMTAEQWSKFQALMPKRKDGGA